MVSARLTWIRLTAFNNFTALSVLSCQPRVVRVIKRRRSETWVILRPLHIQPPVSTSSAQALNWTGVVYIQGLDGGAPWYKLMFTLRYITASTLRKINLKLIFVQQVAATDTRPTILATF